MGKLNQSTNIEAQNVLQDCDRRDDQILELSSTVSELADENKLLRDGIMARIKPSPEDGSISMGQVIAALEKEIYNLHENIRVLRISRDGFMNDVGERQRAAIYWRSRAKKAERQIEGVQKNA